MIIGDDFVYIHTPKTAGSSFEAIMKERHGLDVHGDQHNAATDIPAEHSDKFTFGFLRDPLMAEVSNWRYHAYAWKALNSLTFERWCTWRYDHRSKEYGEQVGLTDHQVDYGYIFNVRPSAGYFCDSTGKCVADVIYRYEEIEAALEDIGDRLGKDCSISGFTNMSYSWGRGREDYAQHVTDKAYELVYKAKKIDFDLHGTIGPINVDYHTEVAPTYAYTRP